MYIHILWIKMGKLMYKMIGMVPNLNEGMLKSSTESFHSITPDERESIYVKEFEIVKARQNDTFESIGKRHGSKIKPEINAFLNGKEPEKVLEKGELVKIVIEKPYRK